MPPCPIGRAPVYRAGRTPVSTATHSSYRTVCAANVSFLLPLGDASRSCFPYVRSLRCRWGPEAMRRLVFPAVLLALLALASSASATTVFVIKGKGWGHGVGMSQWGAFGLAKGYAVDHPYTWQEIMAHYFRNTTIGDRSGDVQVLLATGRQSLTVGPAFLVAAGSRSVQHANPSTVTKTSTGRIKVSGITGSFLSPATFSATGSPLQLDSGRHYR